MSDFRIPYRAFDALLTKFCAAIERNALAKDHPPRILGDYKLGYLHSFFAMELANLSADDQVKMFNAIEDCVTSLNQKSMTIELQATKREAMIA